MEWSPISATEVGGGLGTTQNGKACGREQIANFRFKQFTATHSYLVTLFNKVIKEDQIPEQYNS